METSIWYFVLSGIVAAGMIALLVHAARLSYRIETRSGRRPLKFGLPGYANVLPTAFNLGVAADAETQGLRWKMNRVLLVILAGFAALYALRVAFAAGL